MLSNEQLQKICKKEEELKKILEEVDGMTIEEIGNMNGRSDKWLERYMNRFLKKVRKEELESETWDIETRIKSMEPTVHFLDPDAHVIYEKIKNDSAELVHKYLLEVNCNSNPHSLYGYNEEEIWEVIGVIIRLYGLDVENIEHNVREYLEKVNEG